MPRFPPLFPLALLDHSHSLHESLASSSNIRLLSTSSHSFSLLHSLPTLAQTIAGSHHLESPSRNASAQTGKVPSHLTPPGRLTSNSVVDLPPLTVSHTAISRDQVSIRRVRRTASVRSRTKRVEFRHTEGLWLRDTSWHGSLSRLFRTSLSAWTCRHNLGKTRSLTSE